MALDLKSVGRGSRPALIVVDMIYGFTDPESPLGCDSSLVLAANIVLLKAFRQRNFPVFFTTVTYDNKSQANVFRRKLPDLNILSAGSHWVEVHTDLGRRPEEVLLQKHWASAFAGTDLIQRLKKLEVDALVVTGLTTSGCVRATAVDGLQHNFPVIVPREAVGDSNLAAHVANLADLNRKYADVLSLDDVLAGLPALL